MLDDTPNHSVWLNEVNGKNRIKTTIRRCNKHNFGNKPGDFPFGAEEADFFRWPDVAASVGGGLRGFFARFPSFDAPSPLRLIVYGSSSELANITTHIQSSLTSQNTRTL